MSEESNPTYDVFLSYSSHDKTWADAACAVLERHRIRCWIAPRDITPGEEWGASIVKGIDGSRMMVLMFSSHANASPQVRREVDRAISQGMTVMPIRIEDVRPEGAMEFALSNTHWLDAFTPPVERHLEMIAQSVKALLHQNVEEESTPEFSETPTTPPIPATRIDERGPSSVGAGAPGWPSRRPLTFGLVAAAVFAVFVLGIILAVRRGDNKPLHSESKPTRNDLVISPRPEPLPPAPLLKSKPPKEEFLPLFNGQNLTGWDSQPPNAEVWQVENGVLRGSGKSNSQLYTVGGDYQDFHLRVEARINGGGNSGVLFRASSRPASAAKDSTWLIGYQAQINASARPLEKTGSLFAKLPGPALVAHTKSPVPRDQWFTLEVIAQDNQIVIKVNGTITADYTDETRLFSKGRLALQKANPETVAEFRKIEIKELNGSSKGKSQVPEESAARELVTKDRFREGSVWHGTVKFQDELSKNSVNKKRPVNIVEYTLFVNNINGTHFSGESVIKNGGMRNVEGTTGGGSITYRDRRGNGIDYAVDGEINDKLMIIHFKGTDAAGNRRSGVGNLKCQ